jgi:hypothetical protein
MQFVPLVISSAINMYDLNFSSNLKLISSIISFIVIPMSIIIVVIIVRILKKNNIDENFNRKYGELIEGL